MAAPMDAFPSDPSREPSSASAPTSAWPGCTAASTTSAVPMSDPFNDGNRSHPVAEIGAAPAFLPTRAPLSTSTVSEKRDVGLTGAEELDRDLTRGVAVLAAASRDRADLCADEAVVGERDQRLGRDLPLGQ